MQGMTIEQGERLKKLRLKRGFDRAADAARAFGWAVTTYQAHENGSRGLKLEAAARYAKAFNSTAAFILTGTTDGAIDPVNHVTMAPLVGRISAGVFRYDEGFLDESVFVPTVPREGIAAAKQYAVLVDGPSVNKRIPDGMFAICAPYESFPGGARHGQLVHVVRERAGLYENTIKEIHFTPSGTVLMPVSTDPRFQDAIRLDNGGSDVESITLKGIVIGSYQPL